ncbi:hypothetical protein KAH94_04890, partial [bacterium]|nr:hypothetical protein [bacterium]
QKEKNILTTKLNDVGLVEQFFGNVHGKWRRGVIADRIVERLKIITKKNIKLHLKNPNVSRNLKLNNKVVKQFYSQLLDDYVNKKLGPAVKGEKIFSINIDNIQKYSKDICEKKSANDIEKYSLKTTINKKQLTEILSSKEMIQDYINVENLQKITILPNNYLHRIENHEKMLKKTKSIGLGARKSDGDWLDAEEMRKIIKNECDHGMLADVKDCTYIVYDDLAVIGKEYDSNCSLILETAKKTIKNPNHKVVFCIGTMSQEKASSGHWFPLVWTSNRCFTMDSLDNKIRLEDKSVKTIFDKFEHSKLCYKAGSVLARNSCLGPCFLNKRSFAMAPLVYLMNKSKFSKKEFSLI